MYNATIKKLTTFLLLVCILTICTFGLYCNAITEADAPTEETFSEVIETINEEETYYETLSSYGYPDEILKSISNSGLKKIIDLIENKKILNVNYQTEYWPNNTTSDSADIVFKKVIAKVKDETTGEISGYTICLYWEWLDKKPLIKEKDFLEIKWNKSHLCLVEDSFYAEDYSKNNVADNWNISDTYSNLAQINQGSIGHWTDLDEFKNCIGGVVMFNIALSSSEKNIDDINLKINYTHYVKILPTITIIVISLIAVFCIIALLKKNASKS